MCRKLVYLIIFALVVIVTPVEADTLSSLADVTVVDGAIISLRYADTEYVVADGDLLLGTTTRWYIDAEVETLWAEGDPAPAATVSGTSNPKDGDVGSNADNFMFAIEGDADNISSIDGIEFQETVFPTLTDTIFLFERGGNDKGAWQAILEDGSLGDPVEFNKAPYTDTGVGVNGQNAFGVVFTTDVPVKGVRITASGHDTLSISIPAPEPILVDPNSDLAAAAEAVQPFGSIVFAEGTYNITSQILVKDGVTYKGAGPGLTIIDGGGTTRAFAAWGDRSFNEGNENDNDSGPKNWVIEGMTIQNCIADPNGRYSFTGSAFDMNDVFAENDADGSGGLNPEEADADSGGIRLPGPDGEEGTEDDDLHRFEHMDTDGNGELSQEELLAQMAISEDEFGDESLDAGAIFCGNQAIGTIANCVFLNNQTHPDGDDGGAIFMGGASVVTITDCTFEGNSADDDGGAVYAAGESVVTITNCGLQGNYCGDDGGAINIAGLAEGTVNDCIFTANYAASADGVETEGFDGDGGHIKVQGDSESALIPGTTLIANRCDFLSGRSEDDGGAIKSNGDGSVVRLDSCWFEGNTAWDNGSVLQFADSLQNEVTVTNCVFVNNITKSDNSPDRMIETRRNTKIVNCTFVGNYQEDQDLIYNNARALDLDDDGTVDETGDTTEVINCIFANNTFGPDAAGDDILSSHGESSITATNCIFFNNLEADGTTLMRNTNRNEVNTILDDPLLDALLVPGVDSPAIDNGADPATVGVTITTDLSGNPRPQGAGFDIGAYEVAPAE